MTFQPPDLTGIDASRVRIRNHLLNERFDDTGAAIPDDGPMTMVERVVLGNEGPNVEVTPAMIEAGQRSWIEWTEAADFSTERLVEKIFRAMAEAAPCGMIDAALKE